MTLGPGALQGCATALWSPRSVLWSGQKRRKDFPWPTLTSQWTGNPLKCHRDRVVFSFVLRRPITRSGLRRSCRALSKTKNFGKTKAFRTSRPAFPRFRHGAVFWPFPRPACFLRSSPRGLRCSAPQGSLRQLFFWGSRHHQSLPVPWSWLPCASGLRKTTRGWPSSTTHPEFVTRPSSSPGPIAWWWTFRTWCLIHGCASCWLLFSPTTLTLTQCA